MTGLESLMVAAPVVLAAYVVFGLCGFGSTLIVVSLLAHFLPLKLVVPAAVLLDCAASVLQGINLRANANRGELSALLPAAMAGILIGVMILARAPGTVLLLLLGILVTAYGLYYALERQPVFRLRRWAAVPAGLVAGTSSSAFGIGGVVFVIYLAGRGAAPQDIRATMPVIFVFTTIARIALFVAAGLMTEQALLAAALLAPVMALGLWLGNRWHARVPVRALVRAIGALLAVGGASLIFRAF